MGQINNKCPIRLDCPRVWRTYTGGERLDRLFGCADRKISNYPEAWMISAVAARNSGEKQKEEEGICRLLSHGKKSLKELLEENPEYYLGGGHAARHGSSPGVLVKLIDAAERLTIQVHPDRETAERLFHSPFGKTECWHILEEECWNGEQPCIYIGFKPGMTREKWQQYFEKQDIDAMLESMHRIQVHKGDTILIEGGVPHAIGAGCFLMEIQEPTDYTIRVERMTPAGLAVDDRMCHQGIGFDKMFECFSFEGVTRAQAVERWFIKPDVKLSTDGGSITELIGYGSTPFFALDEIKVSKMIEIAHGQVFSGIYVMEGCGSMKTADGTWQINAGEQYFLPAGIGNFGIEAQEGKPLRMMHFRGPEIKN